MNDRKDTIISGKRLTQEQREMVLSAFSCRPTIENADHLRFTGHLQCDIKDTDDKWLAKNSFWFNWNGTHLSYSKLYPYSEEEKDVSYEIDYSMRGSGFYSVKILNLRTKKVVLDVKNVIVDDLRETMVDKLGFDAGKTWSKIVSKFGCSTNDGYNFKGKFQYNSLGREAKRL